MRFTWYLIWGAIGPALTGCVSLSTYEDLRSRYETLIETKVSLEQEATDARRQLLSIREQQAKLAGQVAALEDSLASRVREATASLSVDVATLKSDRAAALREKQREEQLGADRHRALVERIDHLATAIDRLSDRVTRTEVLVGRTSSPTPKKTSEKIPDSSKTEPSKKSTEPSAESSLQSAEGKDRASDSPRPLSIPTLPRTESAAGVLQ